MLLCEACAQRPAQRLASAEPILGVIATVLANCACRARYGIAGRRCRLAFELQSGHERALVLHSHAPPFAGAAEALRSPPRPSTPDAYDRDRTSLTANEAEDETDRYLGMAVGLMGQAPLVDDAGNHSFGPSDPST